MSKTIIRMVCFGMVLGEIVTILPASAPKFQKPYHAENAYFHGRRVYPVAPFWSEMYGFGMVLVWFFFVRNGCYGIIIIKHVIKYNTDTPDDGRHTHSSVFQFFQQHDLFIYIRRPLYLIIIYSAVCRE
jgi:hypothetical protein